LHNGKPAQKSICREILNRLLEKKHLIHFDSWLSVFGDTTTELELAPEVGGYRSRTRLSKFYNLPELMKLFKELADIKTADTLDIPRPKARYQTVVIQPSELQTEMMKELSVRAADA
jgi:N12 class adenine-specific DNA methylase